MHLEVLVEDKSGATAVEVLLQRLLLPSGSGHSFRIHAYKGIGRLPKDLRGKIDSKKRILLDRLPKVLQGYGRAMQYMDAALIVIVDLDDRDCLLFKQELLGALGNCDPKPRTLFRIAIEELEAWYLGDRVALKKAYPNARDAVLNTYHQDSVCGTWERLADAVYPGGASKLKASGYPMVGAAKSEWATKIGPHMEVDRNNSNSFRVFCEGVLTLVGE